VTKSSNYLGEGLPDINRVRLLEWLKRKGVILLAEVKYEEITDKGLSLTTKDGKQQLIDADMVLVTTPLAANRELYETLEGKAFEIYLIGDCRELRMIVDGIEEGRRVACDL
jgi:pyruvate/2-oxoglutarate dehydrogenase complex dihydrolipoamide dehydrogenase (E3) component